MKKFLALLLCLALVASFGVVAFAEEETTYESTVAAGTVEKEEPADPVDPHPVAELGKFDSDAAFADLKGTVKADVDAVKAILADSAKSLGNAKANLKAVQGAVKTAQAAVIGAMKDEIGALQNAVKALVNAEVATAYEKAYTDLAKGVDEGLAELLKGLDEITAAGISSDNYSITGFAALADLYGTPLTEYAPAPEAEE